MALHFDDFRRATRDERIIMLQDISDTDLQALDYIELAELIEKLRACQKLIPPG